MFYRETELQDSSLGKIPREWAVRELGDKTLTDIVAGQSPPSSTYNKKRLGLPFLQGKMEFGEMFPSPTTYCSEPIKVAEKNDILLSVRAPVGDVNIAPFECCIGRGLAAIRAKADKLDYLFLFYYLGREGRRFEALSTGSTFKAIRIHEIEKFSIPVPSVEEQRAVVGVLGVVDLAIEKTGEVIAKTERLKKGLMQELLTKGIGHKEYRQTPIGKIPKEWNATKLQQVAVVRYGLGQPPELDDNGIPMIRATNIKRGSIIETGLLRVKRSAVPNSRNPYLRTGDVIVVRSGAYTGDIGYVSKKWEGALAGYDLIVSPSSDLDSTFLTHYLLSTRAQLYFSQLKSRSAQPHLNSEQVSETPIPLPPLHEQQQIASVFSAIDEKLDLEKSMRKRFERIKRSLMALLLTGKVRVEGD